jgi:hypothetical protein
LSTPSSFSAFDALLGQHGRMILFVDQIVAGRDLCLLVLFTFFEPRDDVVGDVVFIGRFVGRTRDDQRRTGFVDQDRVDLVNDREIMIALDERFDVELHVVAKIIEAELVIRSVSDVAA